MGSGGSKGYCDGASPGSGSGGSRRKGKCIGRKVFQSSCLGSRGDYVDDVCDRGSKENGGNATSTNRTKIESDQEKIESSEKVKVEQSDGMPCISPSNEDLTGWSQARVTNTGFRTGSSSARAASNQSLPSPSRFFSRFSFIPGNLSFRLSRASSLGSSRAYRVPSSSLRILDDDDYEETNIFSRSANGIGNGSGTRQSGDLFATSVASRIPSHDHEDSSTSFQLRTQSSDFLDNMQDNQTMSFTHHVAGDGGNTVVGIDRNLHSPIIFGDLDGNETRASDRGVGLREPVERNVRFSRTLSVGRLRDRVLRQPSASDLTFCPFQQGREVRDSGQGRRRALGSDVRVSESEGISLTSPTASGNPLSSMSSSLFNFQAHAMETSQSREARYHDLLEHRSNFLERRRRIRSQVRALQRLGGRFENLSGHERSCILSGQHRTGRCTCRVSNRDANINDDTSARASISRIVMLADALFEVLDEIHQQSVVLSSRPSVSSLGSVPAPNEVVESLPVRLHSKSQKHQYEETAQCYICLVEYEEGDSMRVLPCDHEFHRTCVDKWLKEIHRVCPLCRGDICRSDYSLPAADN